MIQALEERQRVHAAAPARAGTRSNSQRHTGSKTRACASAAACKLQNAASLLAKPAVLAVQQQVVRAHVRRAQSAQRRTSSVRVVGSAQRAGRSLVASRTGSARCTCGTRTAATRSRARGSSGPTREPRAPRLPPAPHVSRAAPSSPPPAVRSKGTPPVGCATSSPAARRAAQASHRAIGAMAPTCASALASCSSAVALGRACDRRLARQPGRAARTARRICAAAPPLLYAVLKCSSTGRTFVRVRDFPYVVT